MVSVSRGSYRDLQERTLLRGFRSRRSEGSKGGRILPWKLLGGLTATENFISPPKQVRAERNEIAGAEWERETLSRWGWGRWFVSRCNFKLADWSRVWMDSGEGDRTRERPAKPPFYWADAPRSKAQGRIRPSIDPPQVYSMDYEPFDRSRKRTLKWRVYKIFLSILSVLLWRLCLYIESNGAAFNKLNREVSRLMKMTLNTSRVQLANISYLS